jgi:hypothetical protein
MQIAGKEFKDKTLTSRISTTTDQQLAEEFVQKISSDALILIKSYGVTEQDLINQFGSLDPDRIALTAQIIVAEERLIDEGKTLSIFAQEDYELSSLSLVGLNSTPVIDGNTVGGCLLEAIGIRAVVQVLVGDIAALGTAGVLKIVGNVASKYAGIIGAAVMVYQFADCMGWLDNLEELGVSNKEVSKMSDLVMIKPVTGYFIKDFVYISKKSIAYKSITDFYIDRNFNYKIYTVNMTATAEGDVNSDDFTFSSNETISGRKLDASTIKEAY